MPVRRQRQAEVAPGSDVDLLVTLDDSKPVSTGDLLEMKRRPSKWYRKTFADAGLVHVAPYCFLAPSLFANAAELDIPYPPG